MDTLDQIKEAAIHIIKCASTSSAKRMGAQTIVGVDECVSQGLIDRLLGELVGRGCIRMSIPLWWEYRRSVDGENSTTYGVSGQNMNIESVAGVGGRVAGTSWSDMRVVTLALCQLYTCQQVVILSSNTAGDKNGLRYILNKVVGPIFNEDVAHRLSLVLLLQQPKTSNDRYVQELRRHLEAPSFDVGFHEIRI